MTHGKTISMLLSLVSAVGFAAWGALPMAIQALLVVMTLDIISGGLRSLYQKKISSSVAWAGVTKKAAALVVVALAHYIVMLAGINIPLGSAVAGYYVYTESLSVIENAAATGLPIPQFLRDALAQLAPHKEPAAFGFDEKVK